MVVSCNIQAASTEESSWSFWNIFECCGCRKATNHAIPTNAINHAINHVEPAIETQAHVAQKHESAQPVSLSRELTAAIGTPPFVKRDQVDEKTITEIVDTIKRLKIKWAPVPVNAHGRNLD